MTPNARLYVTVILLLGSTVLALAFASWRLNDPVKFACYFLLAVAASVLKVTVPGMAGRMPFNFVFVLIGLVQLTLPETLLLGCTTVLIECIWRPNSRSTFLDVLFSLSNMAVAIACADYVFTAPSTAVIPKPVLIFLATTAFFLVNTFPLAAVVALTERRPVLRVWKGDYTESYPFYLLGAVVAWAFEVSARYAGWHVALLTLPVAYLLYRTYHLYVARVEDEKIHAEQLASLHLRTIESLALAIEAKDNTTHDHLKRVQIYAMEVGRDLGLSDAELEALQAAAVLHDIGKLAVPEHIISKPGKLTPEEFEKMKIHPVVGAEILEHVQFPYPVVPIVRAHHEKWNGTGYPYGLRGKDIPIGARILSAVDALDALASDRQYRRALPLDEAMGKVEQDSGRAFDPQVVEVLKRRYVELERKAAMANGPAVKLSTDLKIVRGAAPAAGFAEVAPAQMADGSPESPSLDVLSGIAQVRQDLCRLFDQPAGLECTNLDEIFAVFSVRIKHLIPYEAIAVYFVRDEKLVPQYVSGDNYRLFSSLRIPVGQGLSGWVAENRKPILNGNPSVEPGYLNNPSIFSTLRSALAVPLTGSGGVIGVLSFYHESRDAYTQDNLRLAESIGPRLALSVEHAWRQMDTGGSTAPAEPTNAAALIHHIDSELGRAKRLNTTLAVLVFTIEEWPEAAARLGRSEGERLVRSVIPALRDACREHDYIGRMRDNEFVMVMPGLAPQIVRAKAAKLMQISIAAVGRPLSVLAADGLYPEDGDKAESLLNAADRRLFELRFRRQAAARVNSQAAASGWVQ
jgi:putative nucleotidyltransferase with HDIG domain/diguanylate cyclase (GGDEF)-like protein